MRPLNISETSGAITATVAMTASAANVSRSMTPYLPILPIASPPEPLGLRHEGACLERPDRDVFRCHILSHEDGGMMGVVDVER